MTNKKPISYLQTDPRWKNIRYAVSGEVSTIGSAGCGPTSAAMLIATITGKPINPVDTCGWALTKGYKALKQGTYYSYFVPQFREYGIKCLRLNEGRIINDPANRVHDQALQKLKDGHYIIALMGPGLWTSSGHFIVLWEEDGVYFILDPASTRPDRLRGDINRFRRECRMYWAIEIPKEKEEPVMEGKEIHKKLNEYLSKQPTSAYAKESSEKGIASGLFADGDGDGLVDNPKGFLTREQLAVVLNKAGLLDK